MLRINSEQINLLDPRFYYPQLGKLRVIGRSLNDTDVPIIAAFLKEHPEIIKLDLSHNSITAAGVKEIADIATIKKLNFRDNHIDDNGAKYFEQNKHLLALNLSRNEISDVGLKSLIANPNLEALYLSGNNITSNGILLFANHPKLNTLDLANNKFRKETTITKQVFLPLTTIPNLTRLNLDNNYITDDMIEVFAHHQTLMSFDLNSNVIRIPGIKSLLSIPNLVHLDLRNNKFNADACAALLATHTNLTSIKLAYNYPEITSVGVKLLSNMQNLISLTLNGRVGDRLDDTILVAFANHPNIENLELTTWVMSDNALKTLASNKSLKNLTIYQFQKRFTDDSAKCFINHPSIQQLNIDYKDLSKKVRDALFESNPLTNANDSIKFGNHTSAPSLLNLCLFKIKSNENLFKQRNTLSQNLRMKLMQSKFR